MRGRWRADILIGGGDVQVDGYQKKKTKWRVEQEEREKEEMSEEVREGREGGTKREKLQVPLGWIEIITSIRNSGRGCYSWK